jgi:AcrR family transcriptional regulator
MTETGEREPQQERSRATRRRLLESAVDSLAELGWNGSTVAVVAARAGVSRGAAQHHFPTREDLFAAAVEQVTADRVAEIKRELAALAPGLRRTEAIVDMLVRMYTGPLFRAALHLWVAASTESQLKDQIVPLEAHVGRAAHRAAVELLDVDETVPGVRESVQATLDLARGLGLANVLTDDSHRRAPVVRQWAAMLETTIASARSG